MGRISSSFTFAIVLGILLIGCRGVGFRDLDTSSRYAANESTARDVLSQVQGAIKQFYAEKHHYPIASETHLYDSIHNFFAIPIDPTHLYRNDGGKGYFIAIGGRANRIVYRYPPTMGPGDYTLYWVGENGVDEEGEGDDLDAWEATMGKRPFERKKTVDLLGESRPVVVQLSRTGPDLHKDSVILKISRDDTVLYRDHWPLSAYFSSRPDITEADRKRIVHSELERFLNQSEFVPADSIARRTWGPWAEYSPTAPDQQEMLAKNGFMFNYYAGVLGSRGIAWAPTKKRFVVVWKTT